MYATFDPIFVYSLHTTSFITDTFKIVLVNSGQQRGPIGKQCETNVKYGNVSFQLITFASFPNYQNI